MSDRLAVFDEGRIEQIGSPAEVYEHPETEFVAGFVGISNVLERDGRSPALVAGGLLAFALSFDEVVVTYFTAGAQNTLPLLILGYIRLGQQLPVVNAIAFVMILLTVIPVALAQRLMRDTGVVRRGTPK